MSPNDKNKAKKAVRRAYRVCAFLTVTFIALKVTNVITWPWLWVLSPLWLLPAVIGLSFLGLVAGLLVCSLIALASSRARK